MRKQLNMLKQKLGFLGAVTLAAIIGGVTTSLVNAAIPNSTTGEIASCYSTNGTNKLPKGSLRVIDNQASPAQTCTAQETALNWDKNGPIVLKDANGQILGDLITYVGTNGIGTTNNQVYNRALDRVIAVSNDSESVGEQVEAFYSSSDCTGQPYLLTDNFGLKTSIFTIGSVAYVKVADNTVPSTVNFSSILTPGGECLTHENSRSSYTTTTVSLPFTLPLVLPFKF